MIRTSVGPEGLTSADTVRSLQRPLHGWKTCLSERLKTMDLKVRPIFHWLDDRIRAHVFLCMLA